MSPLLIIYRVELVKTPEIPNIQYFYKLFFLLLLYNKTNYNYNHNDRV